MSGMDNNTLTAPLYRLYERQLERQLEHATLPSTWA